MPELDAPAPGILTFTPRIRKALLGIELNCSESILKFVYALFKYVCLSSIISLILDQVKASINWVDELSAVTRTTLTSTGKAPVKFTRYSFWYASAVRPVIVSDKTSLKPPPLYWTCIFKSTVEPNMSPLSVTFCSCGNVIVTFTASTFVFVIWRVTAFDSPEALVPADFWIRKYF